MDLESIKGWIVENLKRKGCTSFFDKNQNIGANWMSVAAPNGEYYDGYIQYIIDANRYIYFTRENVEISTGFSSSKEECEEEKLDKLIQSMEEKFSEGGRFYIELAKGEFKLIKM